MPTGTYTIDSTNNAEPLDSRYVADFPAELRAMKTRMNAAISSIGELTGALMADGTNNMTGKLGIGGVASAGLLLHVYGNARMEGTVTVIGKQDITGSSFFPSNAAVTNAASTVRGAYGGGYLMVDGAVYGGSWLAAGSMFWGLGTSAGLAEKVRVSSNTFQFTSDSYAQVIAKASSGSASFYVNSSGTNPGYIFFENASGERARIVGTADASMLFCLGGSAENALSISSDKSALLYGSELSIGVATPGEKRLRFHNEYGSTYLVMSPDGEFGLFDPVTGVSRAQFAVNGLFQTAGDAHIGSTGAAVDREMRLRNANRQVALVLESGGAAVHLRDTTGNNALWSSNIVGDFTARGNVTAYSDARLKHDIRKIDNALEIVQQLRGVRFKWDRDGSEGIGFIAQEVEEFCPELVVTGEHKSVAYGNFTAILVEAVKELRAEVEQLRAELAILKSGGENAV